MDLFLTTLREMTRWNILLDILAIAAILYVIYLTLRATGTWKIAVGLLLAVVGAGVANFLDLQGIAWIFSNLSQITLIALVIIFQPEIRRVLERTISLGKSASRGELSAFPELLDEVLFSLADRRWGALVVIPGQIPIQQWVTEGIALDGQPSSQLLTSIFDPSSPGHDGAVLIENNKITRFGVRLPLSSSNRLPSEFGTRHHAAMGLAEQTDALIFAVSEERGVITAFQNGKVEPLRRKGEVKEHCRRHGSMSIIATITSRARRDPRKMALEMAACFLVAVFFWGSVISGRIETREMFITIPVEYGVPAKGLTLAGEKGAEVKVQLQGPFSSLADLDLSRLRIEIDLSSLPEGKQTIMLSEKDLEVPKGVQVVDIQPPYVTVDLKTVLIREMKIKPQLVGDPPDGYRVASVEVKPKTAMVLIASDVKRNAELQLLTTPIYLKDLIQTTTLSCKIIAPHGVQSQDEQWPDVEVTVVIEKST